MSDPDDFEVAEERLMSVFTYASTSGDYTTIYTVELDSLLEERDALRAERDRQTNELEVGDVEIDAAQARIARLEKALSDTAGLLYRVWRCNTDDERQELGDEVGAAVEAYSRHPSNFALSQHTESPRPANCDCGCSPPGPGLHYANCPAATADDTESPGEPS